MWDLRWLPLSHGWGCWNWSSLGYYNCRLRVGLIESSVCPDRGLLMQVRSSWFIPLSPLFLFRGPSMSCLSGFCMFWMLLFRQSALITVFWEHPLVQLAKWWRQSHLCTEVPNHNSYWKFNGGDAGMKILVEKRLKKNGSDFFIKQQMVNVFSDVEFLIYLTENFTGPWNYRRVEAGRCLWRSVSPVWPWHESADQIDQVGLNYVHSLFQIPERVKTLQAPWVVGPGLDHPS